MLRDNKPGCYTAACLILIFTILLADQFLKWRVVETALRIDLKTTELASVVPDAPEQPVPDFQDWFFINNPLPYFESPRYDFKTVEMTPWLNFTVVWNQGISFGLFDNGQSQLLLIGLAGLISLFLLAWLARTNCMWTAVSISLIVGGAVGNIMDRIRFGAVVDFIDLHWKDYHWPAFNLADSYIVLGAVMLALSSMTQPSCENNSRVAGTPDTDEGSGKT